MQQSPLPKAAQITYYLVFNLPRGKVSFHAFGGNPSVNHSLDVRYRLCVKNASEEMLSHYIENSEPLPYKELSALVARKKKEGQFLTGDIFVIEVYDRDGRLLFKQRSTDTSGEWPADATGEGVTYANYHAQIPKGGSSEGGGDSQ